MKAIPLKDLQAIKVVWADSNYVPGWNKRATRTAGIPVVTSLGFVTHSDKETLEITSHIGDEGGKLNPTSIPWRSILSIRKVQ